MVLKTHKSPSIHINIDKATFSSLCKHKVNYAKKSTYFSAITRQKSYIVTGAPGTGKTSVMKTLEKNGRLCAQEVAREVIRAQQQTGGIGTPWQDIVLFAELVYQRYLLRYQSFLGFQFSDRSLLDVVAYLKCYDKPIPKKLLDFPYRAFHQETVFLAPLWDEIYEQDEQREQSLEDQHRLYAYLKETYQAFGFTLIELPKSSIEQRAQFMLQHLDMLPHQV